MYAMKSFWIWILFQCFYFKDVKARIAPLDPESQQAVGLENGKIPDKQIYAEDSVHFGSFEARYCRLNNKSAWCIENDPTALDEYFSNKLAISVDFIYNLQINAIALQGYKTYRYGKDIWIRYFHGGSMNNYIENGQKTHIVKTLNLKGDDYEYLILNPPIHASKLLVKIKKGANTKCLRMEMYGNVPGKVPQRKEFNECTQTNIGLVTKDLGKTFFTQTGFLAQQISFNAEHLPTNMPYAWCLKKDNISLPYEDWASVNLKINQLVYGLRVDGFRDTIDKPSDKYLPTFFKFQYSLDSNLWADYEGGRELRSLNYSLVSGKKLLFKVPLLAQYVRIRMKIDNPTITCIKLQVYGCPAIKAPARIFHYKIYQGDSNSMHSWEDTKYPYNPTLKEGFLSRNTGCLTDGEHLKTSSPLTSDCWVGWNKTSRPKPLLALTLTAVSKIYAVKLLAYVNESAQAGTIQKFSVEAGRSVPIPTLGYVCAPDSMYYISPQVIEYTIDLGGILAKEISIKFDYSMEWIFLRQVSIVQESSAVVAALKLSPQFLTCKAPEKPGPTTEKDGGNNIIIIVCAVLAFLFLCLLIFIIYHYRTSLHKVFKSRANRPIYVRNHYDHQSEDRVLLNSPSENHRGFSNTSTPYAKVSYKGDKSDDVYAAPDVTFFASNKNSSVGKDAESNYAKYSAPNSDNQSGTTNSSLMYAQPNLKQQYAEPNHPSTIYQGSAIYASTYENPYKAVLPSTMYSDPDHVVPGRGHSQRKACRIFPRNQLTFKEKIGVGQFGEVQIAEASGLDEIYGTIGHYNSWGLPDTALVAVKLLKSEDKNIESEFMKEVDVMARLQHENVVRLLGVCKEPPVLMVVEYMENGDLNQFLRDRKPAQTDNVRISQVASNVLLLDTLLHMIQQITAGMKYLHSEGFIHRDLATRNCLVGPAYQVKISDFGMSRYLYSKHYYRVEGKAVLPIRWMAPECIFYGKFTQTTDIWSFGVTLWEIFTFARDSPYSDLTDPQVIENACDCIQNTNKQFPYLEQPGTCPDDVYELMVKCWHKSAESRPPFAYLYQIFNEKCNSSDMGDI
ncbi:discoidin domain-containing receptor 2-like isoform X2 [Hydractinia symbiolongicarpus]|uniref:discoidin domain-containing receptor 2-like isoform X2 n=1 Tax=Hydractinia symbiolongicarpus TaxID=13093 RepID=UPI00254A74B2|nr:discoidin domain-containing receptor 2-like isoform X2 [Hydractinia symbiolongicarpus]